MWDPSRCRMPRRTKKRPMVSTATCRAAASRSGERRWGSNGWLTYDITVMWSVRLWTAAWLSGDVQPDGSNSARRPCCTPGPSGSEVDCSLSRVSCSAAERFCGVTSFRRSFSNTSQESNNKLYGVDLPDFLPGECLSACLGRKFVSRDTTKSRGKTRRNGASIGPAIAVSHKHKFGNAGFMP